MEPSLTTILFVIILMATIFLDERSRMSLAVVGTTLYFLASSTTLAGPHSHLSRLWMASPTSSASQDQPSASVAASSVGMHANPRNGVDDMTSTSSSNERKRSPSHRSSLPDEAETFLATLQVQLHGFAKHDGHLLRSIDRKLRDFHVRYVKMYRYRARREDQYDVLHLRHEYTSLYDLRTDVLNSLHALFMSKPPSLCLPVQVSLRKTHARLSRLLRVLRRRHASQLHGLDLSSTRPYEGNSEDPHMLYI